MSQVTDPRAKHMMCCFGTHIAVLEVSNTLSRSEKNKGLDTIAEQHYTANTTSHVLAACVMLWVGAAAQATDRLVRHQCATIGNGDQLSRLIEGGPVMFGDGTCFVLFLAHAVYGARFAVGALNSKCESCWWVSVCKIFLLAP